MRLFLTFSRKSLAVILAVAIIVLIIIGQCFTIKSYGTDGSTNALRVEYLTGLGYKVDDSGVMSKRITIPNDFSDVYRKYNDVQKQAGFDLSAYKGKKAEIYTYNICGNDDTVINVIISDGCIIGGDVSSVRIDGEMRPLMPSE